MFLGVFEELWKQNEQCCLKKKPHLATKTDISIFRGKSYIKIISDSFQVHFKPKIGIQCHFSAKTNISKYCVLYWIVVLPYFKDCKLEFVNEIPRFLRNFDKTPSKSIQLIHKTAYVGGNHSKGKLLSYDLLK